MTIEDIYRWLRFDLQNQIESGKDWFCIGSSSYIDYNGHGIVVWCDEDNGGKYFEVTIRENYSEDSWGDGFDVMFEECTETDSFEDLERIVTLMLTGFYNRKED